MGPLLRRHQQGCMWLRSSFPAWTAAALARPRGAAGAGEALGRGTPSRVSAPGRISVTPWHLIGDRCAIRFRATGNRSRMREGGGKIALETNIVHVSVQERQGDTFRGSLEKRPLVEWGWGF